MALSFIVVFFGCIFIMAVALVLLILTIVKRKELSPTALAIALVVELGVILFVGIASLFAATLTFGWR